MKFFKIAIVTLVVSLLQIASVQAFEIREVDSPGGLKAWLVSDKTVPLITMRFSFRGGTINDPEKMRELIDLGVDGITTDRPDLLKEVLSSPSRAG